MSWVKNWFSYFSRNFYIGEGDDYTLNFDEDSYLGNAGMFKVFYYLNKQFYFYIYFQNIFNKIMAFKLLLFTLRQVYYKCLK